MQRYKLYTNIQNNKKGIRRLESTDAETKKTLYVQNKINILAEQSVLQCLNRFRLQTRHIPLDEVLLQTIQP